jgi:hypothetical protein
MPLIEYKEIECLLQAKENKEKKKSELQES